MSHLILGRGASWASNTDSSFASALIRSVRCSWVIRRPFARHTAGDCFEHCTAGAPAADFDVSFPRRLVDFDDEASPFAMGFAAQGATGRGRNLERGVPRLNRRPSI